MPKNPVLKFNGMNNRVKPYELGADKAAYAKNVQFTNQAELVIPGREFTTLYAVGSCHSVNSSPNGILYAASGTLYKYAATPVALKASVGSNAFSYTRPIGDTVYFSNGSVTGRYVKGEVSAREWGTTPPTAEPTMTAIDTGGMTAGTYRVVTTWIADEESGAGNSTEVTVAEGGGIRLTGFATPPSYVTKIGVYCSQCNGKDLYLYGEYDANTTTVTISDFKGAIPLDTQFGVVPNPAVGAPIIDHYGRIYWGDGYLLRYTHIGRFGSAYGMAISFNYFPFDSDVQTVVSAPGVLYVGTLNKLYKITNIDGDGPPIVEQLQDVGSVKGSECYDPDGVSAYFMSHRGFIRATPEGLQELSFADIAMPLYSSGTMTVTEQEGRRYLFFKGTGGTINKLSLASWNDNETFPHTGGWALNLDTGAVSQYDLSITNLHNGYASTSSGIAALDDPATSVGILWTGRHDFGSSQKKKVPDAYLEVEGDELTLSVVTDNGPVDYFTYSATERETIKMDLARGARGRYWQLKLANKAGKSALVSEIELNVIPTQRHR